MFRPLLAALGWTGDHDAVPRGGGRPVPRTGGWRTTTVQGLAAAYDTLDALEAAGYEERELRVRGALAFEVRWR